MLTAARCDALPQGVYFGRHQRGIFRRVDSCLVGLRFWDAAPDRYRAAWPSPAVLVGHPHLRPPHPRYAAAMLFMLHAAVRASEGGRFPSCGRAAIAQGTQVDAAQTCRGEQYRWASRRRGVESEMAQDCMWAASRTRCTLRCYLLAPSTVDLALSHRSVPSISAWCMPRLACTTHHLPLHSITASMPSIMASPPHQPQPPDMDLPGPTR